MDTASLAAAPAADQSTPTARDVARHHRRWNTGWTALAPQKNDWKFSVPLKPFPCPHSRLFRTTRSHWQDVLCDDLVRTPSTTAAAAAAADAAAMTSDSDAPYVVVVIVVGGGA